MEKETVLARLRFTIGFTEEAHHWLSRRQDFWGARDGGDAFLSEFGGTWTTIFKEEIEAEVQPYFRELGVPPEYLPYVRVGERYRGSFVIEGAIAIALSIGSTFQVLKGVSELPKIADGVTDLKDRIAKRLDNRTKFEAREKLLASIRSGNRMDVPSPREALAVTRPIYTNFVLDARPVLNVRPSLMKQHALHMAVAVSRDTVTIENLGDTPLQDIGIGLFSSPVAKNQWSFADAYAADIPYLSSRRSIGKNIHDFRNPAGRQLALPASRVHVDCWVQDSSGIYLFMFFLEEDK